MIDGAFENQRTTHDTFFTFFSSVLADTINTIPLEEISGPALHTLIQDLAV